MWVFIDQILFRPCPDVDVVTVSTTEDLFKNQVVETVRKKEEKKYKTIKESTGAIVDKLEEETSSKRMRS